MIRHLINYGVNLNLVNIYGYTPFHLAVDQNLFDVCRLLVEAGCDMTKELEWIQVSLRLLIFSICCGQCFRQWLKLSFVVMCLLMVEFYFPTS